MKYTVEELIEKIVRAKIKIEAIPEKSHGVRCPYEDPESYAPCTCGASDYNAIILGALKELKL